MIKIEIEPDARGGYTLRVADGHNGETLLSSTSQSYDGPTFPEALARRLFGVRLTGHEQEAAMARGCNADVEPVTMVIRYRDGKTKTVALR